MSFKEPNNSRSSKILNNQILLTELAMYEEWPQVFFFYKGALDDIFLFQGAVGLS